jgi:hypothetical protein
MKKSKTSLASTSFKCRLLSSELFTDHVEACVWHKGSGNANAFSGLIVFKQRSNDAR